MEIIDKIKYLFNQDWFISILLLLVCLYMKKEKGYEWETKLMNKEPKLYHTFRFFTDFSIDVIPIIGYYLISCINNNVGTTLICGILMGFVIYIEIKIRNNIIVKRSSYKKIELWGIIFLLLLITAIMSYSIYLIVKYVK